MRTEILQVTGTVSQHFLAKCKDVPVLNQTPRDRSTWWSGIIPPYILNLDTWRWVTSFTFRPLSSEEKIRRYQLYRSLVQFDSRPGGFREEKNLPLLRNLISIRMSCIPEYIQYPDWDIFLILFQIIIFWGCYVFIGKHGENINK